ncbi:PREDICTED: uncharacterized protein C1orf101 homolog [Chrysochloris asiatica]|uniref:Uncharacterized protein C1orf101 homolog n=1 Tax=Chrysochloris asiatica TaxID=185453 RepID=A0A9B0TZ20_CHRAS|nr:PREDICTED: uncharacterized protein C1orf101 homolog [Chrysochloris asiatica]
MDYFLKKSKIKTLIHLDYEGTSFSEWSVPESCSVKDKRSPQTELRCPSPGFHHIKPLVTGPVKEERYLSVDNSHTCFMWYYHVKNYFDNLTQVITVWIYDPENADHDELQWNAKGPSLVGGCIIIIIIDKVWKISIPMRKDDVIKDLKGNNVAFQDCFIAQFRFLLTLPLLTIPEIPGDLPLSSPRGSQVMIDWCECVPSSAIVVTDKETFQTNDSFHTWTKIRVPPGILNDAERHSVTDVCLLEDKIFFLINDILYLKDFNTFTRLGRNENIPDNGIVGITSRRWCWLNYLLKFQGTRSIVAIWTSNEVYLGSKNHLNSTGHKEPQYLFGFKKIITAAELKNLLNLSPTATLTIHTIEYTAHPLEFALFFHYCTTCINSKEIHMVIYNEDTKHWMYQDFVLYVPMDSFLVPRFLYSAVPELLLWDKHKIYYSYYNFTVSGIFQTHTESGNLSKVAQNSNIHEIFLDYFGNILIKMENNLMFHTKVYIGNVVQLNSWTDTTMKSISALDISGQLYFIYCYENGTLKQQQYPLKLEVQSTVYKEKEICPYISFKNNIGYSYYIFDKRSNLSFWAQIIYPENIGLHIILESYGPKLLQETKIFNNVVVSGYCTKTMLTNFTQMVDYEGADDYFKLQDQTSGTMLYHIKPSKHSKACTASLKVFQVMVGCNSRKYIAVKGFPKDGCYQYNFSYVIDKSYLRHQPSKNLKVQYDWKAYGCPLKLEFRKQFHPVVQLFDDNGYIEDVNVNFIVWEIHGRNDYSFNTTMRKTGCVNEAQTWKSMTELNKHLPLESAWGPENYKHCFSYAIGKPGDLNLPYEIINSSNNNYIIWPVDHSGMYVFGVKILDPNYSFCNLTTIFAIETFGLILRPNGYLVAAFLFLLMLLFFSILVLSYFQYMKIYRQFIYQSHHISERKKKM